MTLPRVLALMAICLGVIAPAASAADFTWKAGGSGLWSVSANWEGAAAPSGTVGKLSFPASACTPNCPSTNDDVDGLTASTLSIVSPPNTSGEPPRWTLGGLESKPLTLTSGLDAAFTQAGSTGSALATMTIPIALGASNVWTVDDGILELGSGASLTGNHSLTVNLTDGGVLRAPPSSEVGPITITGEGTGERLALDTIPGHQKTLNNGNGNAVALNRVSVGGSGPAALGALTTDDAEIVLGNGSAPGSLLAKRFTLDPATTVTVPITGDGEQNGKDFGALGTGVDGTADLASAQLALAPAQCAHLDAGDEYTFLNVAGPLTGTFAGAQPNTFVPEPACPGLGYLFKYIKGTTYSSVTATVAQEGAEIPPFAWMGNSGSWSDGSRWNTGVAPGQSVDGLAFGCVGSCVADNDITGVTTRRLLVAPGITLTGKAITVGAGGLSLPPAGAPSFSNTPQSAPVVGLPVALGADQAWTLDGNLIISGGLSGAGLRTTLSRAAKVHLSGSSDLGAISVSGLAPVPPEASSNNESGVAINGTLTLAPGASLNTANGNPVTFTQAAFQGGGASIGNLVAGARSVIKVGDTSAAGAKAPLRVSSAAFDPSARLQLSGKAARLEATGSVALGGATLVLSCLEREPGGAAAGPPVGTAFTVVSGPVSGRFANAPASGALVKDSCPPATYRIDYAANGVTATRIAEGAAGGQPAAEVVKAALVKVGKPSGKRARIGRLLKNGGYTLTFAAPSAGALSVVWKAGKKTVARGTAAPAAAGDVKLKVKLTKAGKSRLRKVKRKKSLKLTGRATFTPAGGAPTTEKTTFKVRR